MCSDVYKRQVYLIYTIFVVYQGGSMPVFKKFVKYYKPYRFVFWMDMFCALIVSVVDLAFPQILNWATRDLFTHGAQAIYRILPWMAGGLLAMYILRFLGRYYICLLYTSRCV